MSIFQKPIPMKNLKQKLKQGGFVLAHWDGTTETEERVKEETKATIRCIPFDGDETPNVHFYRQTFGTPCDFRAKLLIHILSGR